MVSASPHLPSMWYALLKVSVVLLGGTDGSERVTHENIGGKAARFSMIFLCYVSVYLAFYSDNDDGPDRCCVMTVPRLVNAKRQET